MVGSDYGGAGVVIVMVIAVEMVYNKGILIDDREKVIKVCRE